MGIVELVGSEYYSRSFDIAHKKKRATSITEKFQEGENTNGGKQANWKNGR